MTVTGSPAPILELRDVHVVINRRGRDPIRPVAGVNLTLERGEVLGLVGETGCGKSTLARVAVGLTRATDGQVLFEGRPIKGVGPSGRDRREARIQMVFQNPFSSLNPRRRIGDQVADGLTILDGRTKPESMRRVKELFELVGIPPAAFDRFPHQFSGGQRQRIAIARTLAASPTALVLDEPLSSLDASAQAQLANLLTSLARELNVAMLLISHDLAIVHQVADRLAVMYLGQIVELGPTRQTWKEPLHPYTSALIAAIPRADGAGVLPEALVGEVPDPAHPPAGCRFHPRCPKAFDRCPIETPRMLQVRSQRSTACWLHPLAPEIPPASGVPAITAHPGPQSGQDTQED